MLQMFQLKRAYPQNNNFRNLYIYIPPAYRKRRLKGEVRGSLVATSAAARCQGSRFHFGQGRNLDRVFCSMRSRLSRDLAGRQPQFVRSRPRKLRLSRELAEKNIRLSRRENSGLNTKKYITTLFPQVIRQSPRPALFHRFHITPPVRYTGLGS